MSAQQRAVVWWEGTLQTAEEVQNPGDLPLPGDFKRVRFVLLGNWAKKVTRTICLALET